MLAQSICLPWFGLGLVWLLRECGEYKVVWGAAAAAFFLFARHETIRATFQRAYGQMKYVRHADIYAFK